MKKVKWVALLLILTGCSTTKIKTLETDDMRACAQNFSFWGTFLSGRSYKTFSYVSKVTLATAMKRAAKFTKSEGLTIVSMDESSGLIRASQPVASSRLKGLPLDIEIKSQKQGVKVSMSFSLPGGATATAESIKNHFCSTIAAVKSGK